LPHIKCCVVALIVGATAGTTGARAQELSGPVFPEGLSVTNGIEGDLPASGVQLPASLLPLPAVDSLVALPKSTCPLTPGQLTAVRTGVASGFVGVNAYLYHYFKKAWWSGERAPRFFFHADWDQQFRDQDKFGHMLGGYHLARFGYLGLRGACVGKTKAIIWSGAYAAAFQLQIEIFDGQFKKYGFSYADMIANTTGQTLAVLQEVYPSLRAVKPTVSYHKTRALRSGMSAELRPSLDYAGQTYWFSTDVARILPEGTRPYWPDFIRFSVGQCVTD